MDTSRQLSFVRIHVEQATGVLRQKDTILEGNRLINMLMTTANGDRTIDKIGTVCCAPCNWCDSVVQFQ